MPYSVDLQSKKTLETTQSDAMFIHEISDFPIHDAADFPIHDAAIEKFKHLSTDIDLTQKSLKKLESFIITDKVPEEVRYFLKCSRTAMCIATREDGKAGKTTGHDYIMSQLVHSIESNESKLTVLHIRQYT